jgi:hypothetical protein
LPATVTGDLFHLELVLKVHPLATRDVTGSFVSSPAFETVGEVST